METYDVVVIGAGLAGLQCARLLGREGLSVLLADARPSVDRSIHTTGIFVRKTLEDFDLPATCLGPPVRDVTLYSPARRTLRFASRHDEFRIGRMGALYAHLLADALSAGVTWAPATRYAGSEASEGSERPEGSGGSEAPERSTPPNRESRASSPSRSSVSGGTAHAAGAGSLVRLESEGGSRWVRCRFLIGADGARSLVAQDLGLDVNREWIVGVEEVFVRDARDPRDAHDAHDAPGRAAARDAPRLHAFLDPVRAPGYLAWVADDGAEIHVGVGGYPERFDPMAAMRSFKESLDGVVDLRGARSVERRGGRIPVGGVLRRIACPRGLLVGDAAGAPSPLTAGGLDPCMRLSAFAARIVPRYLDTGDPAVVALYSGARFRSRFIARRWMRRVMARATSGLAVEGGFALLRAPLVRTLARRVFFGRGSFPDIAHSIERRPRLLHRLIP